MSTVLPQILAPLPTDIRGGQAVPSLWRVRDNFRMPDVLSIPFKGGLIISYKIGSNSLRRKLMDDSMSFGGDKLTATDGSLGILDKDFGESDHRRVMKRYQKG